MCPTMTVAEIMGGSLIGRKAKSLEVQVVGNIEDADLALLASERGIQPNRIKKLCDRHHALARCLASGMRNSEASAVTGYTPSRISILRGDPSFNELIEHYRAHADSAFADFHQRAQEVTLAAMTIIQDRLEESPEDVPTEQAVEIAKTFADRTGHAPVARSVSVSVNADLGARLAAARLRLGSARAQGDALPSKEVIEVINDPGD